MRSGIYARVSDDASGEARSCREQVDCAQAWAARDGHEVVGVWQDNNRSASRFATKQRQDWRQVMAAIEGDQMDVLLLWEPSRATRDRKVWAALAGACETAGVQIGLDGKYYDLDDPEDAFFLDLMFSLAVRESAVTRKRVLRTVHANAMQGRPHGRILYGYRREYERDRDGRPKVVAQVPDESTAWVVQEACRRILAGEALYGVAADFNRRGIPAPSGNPAGWDPLQVRRLCVNPGYAGLRVFRGQVLAGVEAAWPPLVDMATHHGLVARLTDPARRTQRDSTVRYLLSGIARCGAPGCGGTMRALHNRGDSRYTCKSCFKVVRSIPPTDARVTVAAITRLQQMDLADLISHGDGDQAAAQAHRDAKELTDRLDGFIRAAAAGQISPTALGAIEADLRPQIERAEQRAARMAVPPVVLDAAGPAAEAKWESMGLPQRRELIRCLMEVVILPVGRGHRTFRTESVQINWLR